MNRDLMWIGLALGGVFGAAYLNETYNLANPELEHKLLGCWAGSTGNGKALSGAAVLQVNADGTFSERAVERFINEPKFVGASGTWKVHKNRWVLEYRESTASFIFPHAGRSLKLVVVEVTDSSIRAKGDYAVSLPYEMSRVTQRSGQCQLQL